jgi:hypothetical protein
MDAEEGKSCGESELSGVVAVDDSGTPGVTPKSSSLHADRKTWAAVIVPPAAVSGLRRGLQIFIDGVRSDYGVDELHFTDIYNGRRAFRNVAIEKRYELLELMATMFRAFKLPIIIQTCSPEHLAEIRAKMADWPAHLPWFKIDNHEHVALLFLLCRVRMFIREESKVLPQPLSLIIDEGLQKSGNALSMSGWADLFAGGRATFQSSHQNPFLQLADFAAFVVARVQWIVSAGVSKHRDREFLKIVSPERLWVVNLPAAVLSADENSAGEYERVLQADRLLKGLPLSPPWRGRIVKSKGT